MVNIVQAAISEGMCSLKSLFQNNFPGVLYKVANAKRRILQMPLVTLLLKMKKGKANIYVMELIHGVDYYEKLADVFESNAITSSNAIRLLGIGSETADTDSSNDCGDRLAANSCYINEELISLLRASQFNWFEVVDTVVSAMYVMMKKKQ